MNDTTTPSHLTKLSDEALLRVFELTLAHPYDEDAPLFPSILLSQVCRRWRQVVFSTSSLWSRLVLSGFTDIELRKNSRAKLPEGTLEKMIQRDCMALEMYMQKSKKRPLDLVLYFDYGLSVHPFDFSHENSLLMDKFLPLLSSFAQRCKRLEYRASVGFPRYTHGVMPIREYPAERTALHTIAQSGFLKEFTFISEFNIYTPHLECPEFLDVLRVKDIDCLEHMLGTSGISNCRSLEIFDAQSWMVIAPEIQTHFNHLEELTASISQDAEIDTSGEELRPCQFSLQSFPELKKLCLTFKTLLDSGRVISSPWTSFKYLDLPSLEEMEIIFSEGETPPRCVHRVLEDFFGRSPLVESVKLYGPLPEDTMLTILRSASSLKRLETSTNFKDNEDVSVALKFLPDLEYTVSTIAKQDQRVVEYDGQPSTRNQYVRSIFLFPTPMNPFMFVPEINAPAIPPPEIGLGWFNEEVIELAHAPAYLYDYTTDDEDNDDDSLNSADLINNILAMYSVQ